MNTRLIPLWVALCIAIAVAAPAQALVSMDPDLARELEQRGVLESVMRQLRAARDRGFFDVDPVPPNPRDAGAAKQSAWHVLVVLADFDDKPNLGSYDASAWQNQLFSQGTHATGSFTDIYLENSYGNFLITGDVVGWYRMPQDYGYYVNADGIPGTGDDYGFGSFPTNATGMVRDALSAADPDVDFNDYLNGGGTVRGVFVVHAGAGAEQTASADDVWSHQASVNYSSGDGVTVVNYTTEPEYRTGGAICDNGIFAHEFGHVLGLPDLYDLDGSSAGVGRWSMMGNGSWNGGGLHPAHFDAWSKLQLGFATAVDVDVDPLALTIPPCELQPVVYRIQRPEHGAGEVLLLENRQGIGQDAWLPGSGLLVWHIDDAVSNNRNETCTAGVGLHPQVRLLQADGNCNLEAKDNFGDAGDPFPGTAGNLRLGSDTDPDTDAYNGLKTSIVLDGIQLAGSDIELVVFFSDVLVKLVPQEFPTLAQALGVVGPGDEIRVRGGNVEVGSFDVAAGVLLTGGWDAAYATQDAANPSVLQGDGVGPVIRLGAGAATTRVENFAISQGDGVHRFFPEEGEFGGGLYVEDGSVELFNCRFENNAAGQNNGSVRRGGGLAAFDSDLMVVGCSFASNLALEGGAIFVDGGSLSLIDSNFEGTTLYAPPITQIQFGGAVYARGAELVIDSCAFDAYQGASDGGALRIEGGASLVMSNVTVQNCAASGKGGGLFASDVSVSLSAVSFSANAAGSHGGALYASGGEVDWIGGGVEACHADIIAGGIYLDTPAAGSSFRGLVIQGCTAGFAAGGLWTQDGELSLAQTIFHDNAAQVFTGAWQINSTAVSARNSIFSESAGGAIRALGSAGFDCDYNLYWGSTNYGDVEGQQMGAHSVVLDPVFVDAANGDFHLGAGSGAIDAGDPAGPVDFEGSRADLGVFGGEFDDFARPFPAVTPFAAPEGSDVRVYWRLFTLGGPAARADVWARPSSETAGLGSLMGSAFPPESQYLHVAPQGGWKYRVQVIDFLGRASSWGDWFALDGTGADAVPERFRVGQPYPNPFNPRSSVSLTLGRAGLVEAEIFDSTGRRIRVLVNGRLDAGTHELRWQSRDDAGRRVASGSYLLRVRTPEGQATRRLLLLK